MPIELSTRNAFRNRQKVKKGSVLSLGFQVHSAYPTMCGIQYEAKKSIIKFNTKHLRIKRRERCDFTCLLTSQYTSHIAR